MESRMKNVLYQDCEAGLDLKRNIAKQLTNEAKFWFNHY